MDGIGNRVSTLNRDPRIEPVGVGQRIVFQIPDGRWIEKYFRARQRCGARGFWKPLVVANQDGKFEISRLENLVSEVAFFEITLFVEKRIMRNVQLPIDSENRAVRIDHGRRVEVSSVGRGFENRNDDDDGEFLRQIRKHRR